MLCHVRSAAYDCRNNRLAATGIGPGRLSSGSCRRRKYGRTASACSSAPAPPASSDRSGLSPPRSDDRRPARRIQSTRRPTTRIRCGFRSRYWGWRARRSSVSSACATTAKVFAKARRMIEAGLFDAAVVGGVDSLCLTTLYGFHSLELVSTEPCRPVRRGAVTACRWGKRRLRPAERAEAGHRSTAASCSASANQRRLSYVHTASRRAGRQAGDGAGAGRRRTGSRRRSTTSTCTGPRRPATMRRRTGGHGAVRHRHAMQFDQGRHRAHAGCRRGSGSGHLRAGDAGGFMPGGLQTTDARSGNLGEPLPAGERERAHATG